MTPRAIATMFAVCVMACRARHRVELPDVVSSDGAGHDVTEDRAAPLDVVDDVLIAPSGVRLATLTGAVAVDPSLRARAADDADALDRAGATAGQSLAAGDRITTGIASDTTLTFATGASVRLDAQADGELASYTGASLVLSRGMAEVEVPMATGEPLRIDTPAGRVIVSAGRCLLGVGDDGATRVTALEGAVTVWPSPPSPPDRATSLSPDERRRRALLTPGHPVLLDVDLPELSHSTPRPIAAQSLAPGASRSWDASGAAGATVVSHTDARAAASAMTRWIDTRRTAMLRAVVYHRAIEALSLAGAGDVADARVALAHLRMRSDETERARDTTLATLSLALGRLTARARRGRTLATRGGDVTALSQMASLEELRDAARAFAR